MEEPPHSDPPAIGSPATAVRRLPELAVSDRARLDEILDAGLVAHVGFEADGWPYVLPMAYARIGPDLYLHGSVASRLVRALGAGVRVCVTVTLLDGIVLARSAFNTSMNYRSAMVIGETSTVVDPGERTAAFRALLDRVVPGRFATVRAPNDSELRQTLVARLPIDACSAKVSAGPPDDEPDDLSFPVWAGEIPLHTVAGAPIPAPGLVAGVDLPASLREFRLPGGP